MPSRSVGESRQQRIQLTRDTSQCVKPRFTVCMMIALVRHSGVIRPIDKLLPCSKFGGF